MSVTVTSVPHMSVTNVPHMSVTSVRHMSAIQVLPHVSLTSVPHVSNALRGFQVTPLLMARTFLKVYMELGSYFLFLQEQIKDIIIKDSK